MARLASAPLEAALPSAVKGALAKAVTSFLEAARGSLGWASDPASLLASAGVADLGTLRDRTPLARVLELCGQETGPSVVTATVQGAGLGLGGAVLAATEIPLLLGIHLRLLSRLGFCCGFDLRSEAERGYVLGLLELGYCGADRESRSGILAGLDRRIVEAETARDAGGEDGPGLAPNLVQRAAGGFVEKVAPALFRRRAGALVPLLGGALAAGANYALTRDVAEAGRWMLLKRLLVHRARNREPARC